MLDDTNIAHTLIPIPIAHPKTRPYELIDNWRSHCISSPKESHLALLIRRPPLRLVIVAPADLHTINIWVEATQQHLPCNFPTMQSLGRTVR